MSAAAIRGHFVLGDDPAHPIMGSAEIERQGKGFKVKLQLGGTLYEVVRTPNPFAWRKSPPKLNWDLLWVLDGKVERTIIKRIVDDLKAAAKLDSEKNQSS